MEEVGSGFAAWFGDDGVRHRRAIQTLIIIQPHNLIQIHLLQHLHRNVNLLRTGKPTEESLCDECDQDARMWIGTG